VGVAYRSFTAAAMPNEPSPVMEALLAEIERNTARLEALVNDAPPITLRGYFYPSTAPVVVDLERVGADEFGTSGGGECLSVVRS
jgi:hypothetical protein